MKITKTALSLLLIAILYLSLLTGIPFGSLMGPQVEAAGKRNKISKDLDEKIKKNSSGSAQVIIITSSAPGGALKDAIRNSGGSLKRSFNKVKALAASLPVSEVSALAARSDVIYVSADRPTQVTGHLEATTGATQARGYGNDSTGSLNGAGIGIAILDSGVAYDHHAFLSDDGSNTRVVASVDFTGENRVDDPFGHGTHVASMAAGNSHIADGAYTGAAPAAALYNIRVLNSQGQGAASNAIAGIDWCISNKDAVSPPIRVLNLSFGSAAYDSYLYDPVCLAVRQAVDSGLVVCVAAGNLGKDANGNKIYGAIHSPGIEPSAITVGAANTFGTDSRSDDKVATYSSRGPTRGYYTDEAGVKHYDNLIKPDLVAPGNKLIGAASPQNALVTANPSLDATTSSLAGHEMMCLSGTSMATPVVAGAAALLLQRNPSLTPNLVKALLEYTAQPLANFNNFEQGAGLLNLEGAVRLAGLVRTDLNGLRTGDALLNGEAPAQTTQVAGASFNWGRGIIQRWNFISGSDLILKYQGVYAVGALLCDGVVVSDGVLVSESTLLTDGTIVSDGVLVCDGTMLIDGTLFADGTILNDGTMLVDGTLLDDGTLFADSALLSTSATAMAALGVLKRGDPGAKMAPRTDRSKW